MQTAHCERKPQHTFAQLGNVVAGHHGTNDMQAAEGGKPAIEKLDLMRASVGDLLRLRVSA